MANSEVSLAHPSFFRTFVLVAIAAVSLVAIDTVLANTERSDTAREAARFYREGQALAEQHRYSAAADAFRSAIANARSNEDYSLALGQALLDAGQLDGAGATMSDLLRADSMSGAANLVMARVFAKQSQFEEAAFYYHRAVYGQWKQDASKNQTRVRFELAGLLAGRNAKPELLAELLPLQEEASPDEMTQTRLAGLYMTAGSPSRAAAIFHNLARAYPASPEAHAGLGDAEFALGNYTAAQSGFVAVLRLRPGDAKAEKSLELTDQVLNLDPLRRGLSGSERYQRSVKVLQMVADNGDRCLNPTQAQAESDLMNTIRTALARRIPPGSQSEAAEANMDLANKLWQAEKNDCKSEIPAVSEPLQLVLAKAAGGAAEANR